MKDVKNDRVNIIAEIMSWSWKGFWGDDPVYRFNCGPDFFHAGRSKVLEKEIISAL